MAEQKKVRHDSFRITMCIVVACIVVADAFYTHCRIVPRIVEKLTEKGDYKNVIWIVEHLTLFIPVPLVAAVISIFYSNKKTCVPVHSRKERVFIAWMIAVFVYVFVLGYVLLNKGETAEEIKSLWDVGAEWFFMQIIPFAVLISYHSIRVDGEERELSENNDEKKRVEG